MCQWIFLCFEASGLKISLEKSEFFPIRKVDSIERLTGQLGYKLRRLPS